MEIKNKVIIITGASEGIGRATARHLATLGAKLVLAARSAEKLSALAKELPDAMAVPTDVRDPAAIKSLMEKTVAHYGRVDVLINNAGRGLYGALEKIDLKDFQEVMDLNVFAVVRAMQAVIPIMRQQGGGMILNISSRVSKNYFPFLAAYASTKYALNALSLTARTELEKDKIIVSVFHPKMTSTDFGKNALGSRPDWSARPGNQPRPEIDTAEQVAEQIALQIISEAAEASM